MDNLTFQKIKDYITQHQAIGVVVAPNPTLDVMAASLGLYLTLNQMGKQVSIACPTDPTVEISSLVGINRVQKSLGGAGGDLTVSFPYKEGEIEKVSYTLENGKLNIVVKAGTQGLSFQEKDVNFQRVGAMPTLIFTIGVPRLSDVASIMKPENLQNTSIVNIDNKAENEKYGDLPVVAPRFSSLSEQVADFLTLMEPQIELDRDTSQNLLSGILFATSDFKSPSTSYLAFEMAGILMKKGATRGVKPMSGTEQPATSPFFPPQTQAQQPPLQPLNQFNQPAAYSAPVQPQAPYVPTTQPLPVQSHPDSIGAQPMQVAQPMPAQSFDQAQDNSFGATQDKPFGQAQDKPVQAGNNNQTPPDWLTPKVYKGSTVL